MVDTSAAPAAARSRMILAAAELIRRQGVNATGMREIVERADAPRGSLRHYFPGGKDQLVSEAIDAASNRIVGLIDGYLQATPNATPGQLFVAMSAWWREQFRANDFAEGCPFAATTADSAAGNPTLREAARTAFAAWQTVVETGIRRAGVPDERVTGLALVMMSAIEGALILSRANHDTAPLDAIIAELPPVFDAAVPTRRRKSVRRG